MSRGKKSKAINGAVIGFVLGATGGGLISNDFCKGFADVPEPNCIGVTVQGGLIVGGLGAGIGALIGSAIRPDLWEAVPLDEIRVGLLGAADGLAVTASIRF